MTSDPRDVDDSDPSAEALIRHPWLVLEITSPQTLDRDTISKAAAYQSMPEIAYPSPSRQTDECCTSAGATTRGIFVDKLVIPRTESCCP